MLKDGPGQNTILPEADAERRASGRILGHVVHCTGSRAMVAASTASEEDVEQRWAVGRLVTINQGTSRIVGLVFAIETPEYKWTADGENFVQVSIELVGEVKDHPATRRPYFDRGITNYPQIGAIAHRIRAADLAAMYEVSGHRSVKIGALSQDENIAATISIDDMLERHFAIVGTTGVGKSTAVSLMLHKILGARDDIRILILDPHNEYTNAFPDLCRPLDATSLDLPFWMFRLEELTEVLFRGRKELVEEVDLLRDLIPLAKARYRDAGNNRGLLRRSSEGGLTADTPVPYRMTDLIEMIDERIGQLDSKADRPALRMLKSRIESCLNDPRYHFMFASRMIDDTIHEAIGRIFRVPTHGRPVTVFQMAGIPAEVVNSVVSVLSRIAFDLCMLSEGAFKMLVLCEEAHRYVPVDPHLGFEPARFALARIAKEGRKYGCYLGIVTQRPGELDPTILSQCSTVFAMRLANEHDQEIIRSAIANSSVSTLSFLSSIGQREAIAFGEGVSTPMRLKFEKLAPEFIPGRIVPTATGAGQEPGSINLPDIVARMRGVSDTRFDEVPEIEQEAESEHSFYSPIPMGPKGDLGQSSFIREDHGFRASPPPEGTVRMGRRATDPVYRPVRDE